MLKQLSLLFITTLVLTACGGDGKSITIPIIPVSSSSSSSSSSVASSASSAASSVVASTNKVLKVDVTAAGTADWHVQLQQTLKGLDKTKTYTFKYKVKASAVKKVSIQVSRLDDGGYEALPTDMTNIDVTTEWQAKELTIVPTVDDATIAFQANLGNNGAYQIWFDDFSLSDGTTEQFKNGDIKSVDDWILGNNSGGTGVLSIENQDSASSSSVAMTKALKIDVTAEGTADWNVQLQQALTGLDKSKIYTFKYKVKASAAKTVSIQVSRLDDGGYEALPAGKTNIDVTTEWQSKEFVFIPTVDDATIAFQANLGKNGAYQIWFDDFSLSDGTTEQFKNGDIKSVDDWLLGNNGGTGTMSVENVVAASPPAPSKKLKIDVTSEGTADWNVQLQQALTGLDKTKTYIFSYKVKASVPKTVSIQVSRLDDGGYEALPLGKTDIEVTTEWQKKLLIIAPTVDDTTIAFQANLGKNGTYQIWFDDLSLTDGTTEQFKNGEIKTVEDWSLGNNGGTGVMSVVTE